MFSNFLSVFSGLWYFFKIPVFILIGFCLIFTIICMIDYIYLRFYKKITPKKGSRVRLKKRGFFRRVLIDAPLQYVRDVLDRDPDFFPYQGIVIFEGRQGRGKTISMIEFCRKMQLEFPKSVCLSNLMYKYADRQMESWDDLIDFKNSNGDKCGVIVLNDELQNTFNSKLSKDFPMEYLGIVTQNRKNRRILLGTAQNFYMLSKDIRSQCTELRKCFTILGCLTVVHRLEPVVNSSGDVEKLNHRGFYFYVHNPELRSSYDTYEVIKAMRRSGFKPRSEQASSFSDTQKIDLSV